FMSFGLEVMVRSALSHIGDLIAVSLTKGNAIFTSSISSFRRALKRTTIELPKGQAAHVLRHSFASHFMINGGNILTLQRILGHSDIRITMRYAHLAPDHFQDAVKFNPLNITDYSKLL
uniref:tyrosine-type recombinase/integrase n=1 Tax=Marinomonas sp. TaxID=1904862 RepID=UPI003A946534